MMRRTTRLIRRIRRRPPTRLCSRAVGATITRRSPMAFISMPCRSWQDPGRAGRGLDLDRHAHGHADSALVPRLAGHVRPAGTGDQRVGFCAEVRPPFARCAGRRPGHRGFRPGNRSGRRRRDGGLPPPPLAARFPTTGGGNSPDNLASTAWSATATGTPTVRKPGGIRSRNRISPGPRPWRWGSPTWTGMSRNSRRF